MFVQHYSVARSCNHCCHGHETIRSLLIVVDVDVAANNIKVFIFVMEIQQWVPFTLLSS
jgi:hypothetical protein